MGYEFESLSRNLMDVIFKVKNPESLVEISCALLKAKASLLVWLPVAEKKNQGKIQAVYPETEGLMSQPEAFWRWIKEACEVGEEEGFIIDSPLDLDGQSYTGGLIAFGSKNVIYSGFQLALIVLQISKKKPNFLSYHTWVSYNLLRQCEFCLSHKKIENGRQKLEMESRQKNIYSAYTFNKVFPDENWESLNERMILDSKDAKEKKPYSYHGIWIIFQVFKWFNQKKMDIRSLGFETAFQEYTQPEKVFQDYPGKLINWILKPEKNLLSEIIKEGGAQQMISGIADKKSPLNGQFFCLFLCTAWWYVMNRVFIRDPECRSEIVKNKEKDPVPAEVRAIFSALHGPHNRDLSELSQEVSLLMGLTRQALVEFLTSPLYQCPESGLSNWGRSALRLYLGLEITGHSPRLYQLYLDQDKTLEHRHAPGRLRRHFIVNLARFMISVLTNCLGKLGLTMNQRVRLISPSEELDSLLYILDRYAHVQLRVDRQLNIREMLGRQMAAEVHLHLSSSHYRDHLLHAVDVFLLGHLILNTEISWIDREVSPMVDHLCRISDKNDGGDISLTQREDWLRNWAVASLLHDIGYQIGQSRNISRDLETWKNYFSLAAGDGPDQLHFPGNVTEKGPEAGTLDQAKNFLKILQREFCIGGSSEVNILPDLEKMEDAITDHGVLSALRVGQVLLHMANHNTHDGNPLSAKQLRRYWHAIHAISFHNLHSLKVSMEKTPLACLLRLCDELQEWDRRRVNVEKVIKGLYLDIQENTQEGLLGHDLLDVFCVNIGIVKPENTSNGPIIFRLEDDVPHFRFILRFKDAVTAQFDPTMTFLSKSYCFQNLDLSVNPQKQNEIRVMVELQFPVPRDYNGILEYDIYGLFTERNRDLPLLEYIENIENSHAGLVKLESKIDEKGCPLECYGLILQQKSEIRLGWLDVDPHIFYRRFVEFKKSMLPHMKIP